MTQGDKKSREKRNRLHSDSICYQSFQQRPFIQQSHVVFIGEGRSIWKFSSNSTGIGHHTASENMLNITEIQIKATMKYLYTPVRMAKLKWLMAQNVGEDVEQLEFSNPIGENAELDKNFRKRSGTYISASFFLTSIYYPIECGVVFPIPSRI